MWQSFRIRKVVYRLVGYTNLMYKGAEQARIYILEWSLDDHSPASIINYTSETSKNKCVCVCVYASSTSLIYFPFP